MLGFKEQAWRASTKRPDHFMASDYTYDRVTQQFVDKKEVNMYDLLSMEYARIWQRNVQSQSRVFLRPDDDDFLMRRFIIRGLLASRERTKPKPLFKMKKFENVPPRIDTNIRKIKVKALTKGMSEEEKNEIFEEARRELDRKQNRKKCEKNNGK